MLLTPKEHKTDAYLDLSTLVFLLHSWWEKRQPDTERNGFISCRMALVLWLIGILHALYGIAANQRDKRLVTIRVFIGIMIVTGPSSAASVLLVCIQVWALQQIRQHQQVSETVHFP
jgi:hypothetical protein